MMRVVILGNSVAGVKAAEEIKLADPACEVTILAFDGVEPYVPERFPACLSRKLKRDGIFYQSQKFLDDLKINLVKDRKISRINLHRKRIHTEEKDHWDFDILIICDVPHYQLPDIKGKTKTGIYSMRKFRDFDNLLKQLPLVESVAVQSDSFAGFQFACALAEWGLDTSFISSSNSLLSTLFNADVKSPWVETLGTKGLQLFGNNSIVEILGDAEVKAVRLQSGKVLATQMVIMGEVDADLRIFADSPLTFNKKIRVDENFRTSVEGVYALDYISSLGDAELATRRCFTMDEDFIPEALLEEQGRILTAHLLQKDYMPQDAPAIRSAQLQEITLTSIGQLGLNEQIAHSLPVSLHSTRPEGLPAMLRPGLQNSAKFTQLYFDNIKAIGALLLRTRSEASSSADPDLEMLARQIRERRDFAACQSLFQNKAQADTAEPVIEKYDQLAQPASDLHCSLMKGEADNPTT